MRPRSACPSPRRLPSFGTAALPLAIAFTLAAPACEPRIEEPVPPPGAAAPARAIVSPAAPGVAQQAALPERCVRPTPDKPVRPVPPSPDPNCPTDPDGPGDLRVGKIAFKEASGGAKEINVEIAETEPTRERGLMYRKSMPEDHGMIFLFDQRQDHSFWMRNTCIPLDMLFIDDDGLIVGIEENVPTMNRESRGVGCPSRHVLEVNAGWTRKNGVKAGQHVELKGI